MLTVGKTATEGYKGLTFPFVYEMYLQ